MTLLFPNPAPPLLQKILNILKNDVAISLQRMNKRSFDQDRDMHCRITPEPPHKDVISTSPIRTDLSRDRDYFTSHYIFPKAVCLSCISDNRTEIRTGSTSLVLYRHISAGQPEL